MVGPNLFVTAPTFKPRVGGLAGIAEFLDGGLRLDVADAAEWMANPECSTMESIPADCWGSNPLPHGSAKTYEGVLVATSGKRFTGYAGFQCGLEMRDEYDDMAKRALAARENRFVEGAINTLNLTPAPAGTGAGGTIAQAVGQADQALDNEYAGLGVIWMSRSNADLAGAALVIERDDNTGILHTINGTPVVASGAISDGNIYYSGAVAVWRGGVIVSQVVDQTHNEAMAIAERSYVVGFDCLTPRKLAVNA